MTLLSIIWITAVIAAISAGFFMTNYKGASTRVLSVTYSLCIAIAVGASLLFFVH